MYRRNTLAFFTDNTQSNNDTIFNIVTENIDNLKKTVNRDNVNNIIDTKNNLTALQYAVKQGNKDIINLFLGLNANIKVKTTNDEDLIDLSLKYHNRNIIDFMIKTKDDKITILNTDIDQLKDDIRSKDAKITYLNKSMDQTYAKMQSITRESNDNEKKITELKRSNDNTNVQLNNANVDNMSLKRKYNDTKSENDSIIQINNNISTERNILKTKCVVFERENKDLVSINNELKETNSILTDRYTKLDESYNAMLKRNRKV